MVCDSNQVRAIRLAADRGIDCLAARIKSHAVWARTARDTLVSMVLTYAGMVGWLGVLLGFPE